MLKQLIIYKITYKLLSFLLIISINKGWLFLPLFIYKNNKIENILLGYIRLYKFSFRVKGFGFKWKFQQFKKYEKIKFIFLKVGFTHRIVLLVKSNSKYFLKKKKFVVLNRSYFFIRKYLNLLFFLYKSYLYNKKGFFLKGTKFILKLSKKKSKF